MDEEVTNNELASWLCNEAFIESDSENDSETVTPAVNSSHVVFASGSDNTDNSDATFEEVPIFRGNGKSKRKKKIRLADDIRETYGNKILKAINDADFPPLVALLNSICNSEACLYVNRQSKRPHSDTCLYSTCFKGPLNIAQYYYGIMTMEPDAVITLKKSKFYKDSPRGLIVIQLEYRATKMYNVETTYGAIAETMGSGLNTTDNLDMSKLVEQVHELRDTLPIRKKAVKVFTKGVIRAYTNPDKRITHMLMDLNLIENDFNVEK